MSAIWDPEPAELMSEPGTSYSQESHPGEQEESGTCLCLKETTPGRRNRLCCPVRHTQICVFALPFIMCDLGELHNLPANKKDCLVPVGIRRTGINNTVSGAH